MNSSTLGKDYFQDTFYRIKEDNCNLLGQPYLLLVTQEAKIDKATTATMGIKNRNVDLDCIDFYLVKN